MKPEIAPSERLQVDIDTLATLLTRKIEKLVAKHRPKYAYLFAEFVNTPGIELQQCWCGCGGYRLIHKASGLDLFTRDTYEMIPGYTDRPTMERLAYWLSLLDIGKNTRVRDGELESTGTFIIAVDRIIRGMQGNDLETIHKAIKGNR